MTEEGYGLSPKEKTITAVAFLSVVVLMAAVVIYLQGVVGSGIAFWIIVVTAFILGMYLFVLLLTAIDLYRRVSVKAIKL